MLTRRSFGKLTLAALPVAAAWAKINSKIDGVQLGTQCYSFRDLSFNDALKAMVADGLGDCELFAPHIEEGHLDQSPMANFRRMSADERKAARENLRKWRLSVGLDYFKGVRKQFDDAGVNLYAYNYSFRPDYTDDEIERGFEFAKALGVHILTASTTVATAKRVVPFAEKHKILVAMHGHSNLKDPEEFAKPESFAAALEMSKQYRINLDIGHFSAANYDAVDYISKHHEKIVLLHLKDRKKDDGPNTVWGEGDTPIKPVLRLLKEKKWPVPAFIEYEYNGAGSSTEEVKKCFEYCKQALA